MVLVHTCVSLLSQEQDFQLFLGSCTKKYDFHCQQHLSYLKKCEIKANSSGQEKDRYHFSSLPFLPWPRNVYLFIVIFSSLGDVLCFSYSDPFFHQCKLNCSHSACGCYPTFVSVCVQFSLPALLCQVTEP